MRLFAPVAVALAVASAAAGQEPLYYRAPGHALTVRDAPAGAALGALEPNAGPLEATAVDDRGAWARIAFGEADGWVALDALRPARPATAAYAQLPAGLTCFGTEPFWSMRFGPETVELAAPDEAPQTLEVEATAVAQGAPRFPVAIGMEGLTAVLRPQACSDGMSDRSYGWTVDLLISRPGAVALRTGCCRLPVGP